MIFLIIVTIIACALNNIRIVEDNAHFLDPG